jgi:hypothetical protein
LGYDLTITKKEHPSDEKGEQISHEEWFDYVEKHAHLRIDKSMTPSSDSEYVVWGDSSSWLSWSNGSIDSKNPGCDFIEYMINVTDALGAKVLGEESEQYSADDRGYIMHGERAMFLADRSTAKKENGAVRYDYIELESTGKPKVKLHAQELVILEKEMQKLAAMKKSMNRPWWKFW